MGYCGHLDCELYLTGRDQARLRVGDHDYCGRPALDEGVERRLLKSALDPIGYGTLLFAALFPGDGDDLLAGFRAGLVIARRERKRLRFRLHVATSAPPELHALHWERLYDPDDRIALSCSREIAFSRYLSVPAGPAEALPARPKLLVVISAPSDLAACGLPETDRERTCEAITRALSPLGAGMDWELLPAPATVSAIRDRLVAGGFHLLHLHAHGVLDPDRTMASLVLEDDQGQAALVDERLFSQLFEGERDLRLVTLVACHGGVPTGAEPFSGLAPALVHRGIPAVVAMRRTIRVDAAARFSEHLYLNLARSGRIDVAVNEARLQLYLAAPERLTWGTPALFMRFRDGRLWQPTRPAARKFFLSYRREQGTETEVASSLARELREAGHEAFVDGGHGVSTDSVAEIRTRIAWCDFFVVLISEGTVHSEAVQTEVRLADQRRRCEGRPGILPVRVGYFGPLDYELDRYLGQLPDAGWQTPEDSPRVVRELRALAEDRAAEAAPPGPRYVPAEEVERDYRQPQPGVDPRVLSAPGGTIRIDDPFYLRRSADGVVAQRARLVGETLVVKAPRQMGKSSLLLRYLVACRKAGKRTGLLDFSTFADCELEDYPTLLSEIASFLIRAFELQVPAPPRIERQRQLTAFIEDAVLPALPEPIVLAFDEVDRVLGKPFQSDFFSLLRMWHNKRAEVGSPWERVDLALVISTEPYLLIAAADRSPFNVTPAVELGPFKQEQCEVLNERYGGPLSRSELDQLYELLAGHPYLTRVAFYRLVAADRLPFSALVEHADGDEGPFGDHLRALLMKLARQPELIAAMHDILDRGTVPSQDAYYRLHGCGLVRRDGDRVVPSNLLYSRFLARVL